jgi:hypothetical protein
MSYTNPVTLPCSRAVPSLAVQRSGCRRPVTATCLPCFKKRAQGQRLAAEHRDREPQGLRILAVALELGDGETEPTRRRRAVLARQPRLGAKSPDARVLIHPAILHATPTPGAAPE